MPAVVRVSSDLTLTAVMPKVDIMFVKTLPLSAIVILAAVASFATSPMVAITSAALKPAIAINSMAPVTCLAVWMVMFAVLIASLRIDLNAPPKASELPEATAAAFDIPSSKSADILTMTEAVAARAPKAATAPMDIFLKDSDRPVMLDLSDPSRFSSVFALDAIDFVPLLNSFDDFLVAAEVF